MEAIFNGKDVGKEKEKTYFLTFLGTGVDRCVTKAIVFTLDQKIARARLVFRIFFKISAGTRRDFAFDANCKNDLDLNGKNHRTERCHEPPEGCGGCGKLLAPNVQ